MRNFLSKLKSQKGATGADILISASIIVLAIGIVSMMYVNISIQSRNITRTAGATRIATNIIEEINSLSYDDFLTTYKSYAGEATTITKQNTTIFNTKIPKGYTAKVDANLVYGSHTSNAEKFDLVRQIEVTITYSVGKKDENVKFTTVKQRELLQECNEPVTSDLRTTLQTGMNYYPVKYVQSANAYIKTTESDPEWYNYENKNWATVIVSKVAEDKLFDANGKFIATINTTTGNANYTQKFVWIPRYFTKGTSNNEFTSFTYRNNTSKKIAQGNLTSLSGSNFRYYTFANIASTDKDNTSWGTNTGIWSGIKADNTFTSDFATGLNKSIYGPYNIH